MYLYCTIKLHYKKPIPQFLTDLSPNMGTSGLEITTFISIKLYRSNQLLYFNNGSELKINIDCRTQSVIVRDTFFFLSRHPIRITIHNIARRFTIVYLVVMKLISHLRNIFLRHISTAYHLYTLQRYTIVILHCSSRLLLSCTISLISDQRIFNYSHRNAIICTVC